MNSPFFAMGVSYLDAVDVTPLEDSHHVFNFECINKRGGHSTFMILVEDAEPRFDAYWARLKTLGCSYEGAHIKLSIGRRHLLSVDVPPSANLDEVYNILANGDRDNVWQFQEGYRYSE
jgi:Domain of unknown function (DUF4265)